MSAVIPKNRARARPTAIFIGGLTGYGCVCHASREGMRGEDEESYHESRGNLPPTDICVAQAGGPL